MNEKELSPMLDILKREYFLKEDDHFSLHNNSYVI